jgi:hypothetical protein
MLRNLSDGSITDRDNTILFSSYLHNLKANPIKTIRLLAILVIPSIVLGGWYYALAMSVGVVTPLRSGSVGDVSEGTFAPEAKTAPATAADGSVSESSSTSSSSSVSTDRIDLKVDSSSSLKGAVEVNGQSIPVPADGSTHRVIENENGKTTVDINVDSDRSGTSNVRSSTNINLRSSSSTDVDVKNKEGQ